jgi:hypothetical protein
MRGRLLAALLCALLGGVAPGVAQAAANPQKVAAYAQRIYKINLRLQQSISAISDATVKADTAAVEAKLACANELPSDFTGQSQQVTMSVGAEFGFAYGNGALKTYFDLVSAAAARVAAVPGNFPVARTFRSNATKVQNFITAAQGVDACADLHTWKAAGFSAAGEPQTTSQIAQLVAKQKPAGSLKPATVRVSRSQYLRLKQANARADTRRAQLNAEMQSSLKKFFTTAGIPVS